jgi:hypothetical protein
MTTYSCYACSSSFSSIQKFQSHLQRHNSIGELPCPIKCCQGTCRSTFTTVFNFVRHLKSFHDVSGSVHPHEVQPIASNMPAMADDFVPSNASAGVLKWSAGECLTDLRTEGTAMVASLRANSSVPYSVLPGIVSSFNQMLDCAVVSVQGEILDILENSGIAGDVMSKVRHSMSRQADALHEPLGFLSTRYKMDKYFDSHPFAVKPQSVVLGQRFEMRSGQPVLVYDSFQYVSVEATLRSLLHNEKYVELLLQDHYTPGVLTNCNDGLNFKNHALFSDKSKFTIKLQLFYDGMGTTNPLRGQSTLHNVGVFYYVVKNLPDVCNSCFANVHLLCLAYSPDIKVYGFDQILDRFVSEMKYLSTSGFSGDFPIIGNRRVYVGLGQVTCDNLALNGLFGFIESFSGDHFCTICLATRGDIQSNYYEKDFAPRTIMEYTKDLDELQKSGSQAKSHSRGVKHPCILNNIPGFHVTTNYSLDIMHIVLEGVVSVELGCILYALCNVKHYWKLSDLRIGVENFWSKINVDKRNKPPELNALEKPGQRLVPSMKAVQSWALLKYLPLIIGDMVPADDENWIFLLHLSELVDLIYARKFTPGMVSYLREMIAEHLTMFKQLYGTGNDAVTLKPKHHLLVHLPTVILQNGPLIGMNCMCYELKNSFFKRCAHIMCNFQNVCKTLAYRQQQYSLFAKLSEAHVRNFIVVGRNTSVAICDLTYALVLCNRFAVQETDDVIVTSSLERASVEYSVGHHVIVNCDENGLPVFGRIEQFVCLPTQSEWFLVVQCLTTDSFVSHYHSYRVNYPRPAVFKIVAFDDLVDHHAVCCCSKVIAGKMMHFIRLQYHFFKV